MSTVPACIGIIMDGNRRWANARNLPTFEGHRVGFEKLKEVMEWVKERRIPHVVAFAFSTENWKRSEAEVGYLMDLLRRALKEELAKMAGESVRIRFIGDVSQLPPDIQTLCVQVAKDTSARTEHTLTIALSYGGRAELRHAFRELVSRGVTEPSDEDIRGALFTSGIPDPDMVIRTSGEMRLSGFLPWQSVYSELFFTETLWPDFSKKEFSAMLEEYALRDRRRGT